MIDFLIEMVTALCIRTWMDRAIYFDSTTETFDSTTTTWDGKVGVYTRTLDDDVMVIEGVEEDGTALTAAASAALVDATPGAWYFDPLTHVLRVHTTDSAAITGKTMIVLVLEFLTTTPKDPLVRAGVPIWWDPRIEQLPTVSQALATSTAQGGGGAIASFGEVRITNLDAKYDRLIGQRAFKGRALRVLRGTLGDAYVDYAPWATAVMGQPTLAPDVFTVPLDSLDSRFNQPLVTTEFSTGTYPDLDPRIAGFKVPLAVLGTQKGAEAFRIASGVWKLSTLPLTTLTTVRAGSTGDAVVVLATDLANGEFTVDAAYDTEDRLWADCRGVEKDYPGAQLRWAAEQAGTPTASIDVDALAALDVARPAKQGFQLRVGSWGELLEAIAQTAFVDYLVTRLNVFTARVRKRDQGNLITNPDFEVDTTGWTGVNGAVLTRTTATKFRGVAALQIDKPAGEPYAYAKVTNLALKGGQSYVSTMMAALVAGATEDFRISVTDSDGHEYFCDPVTLSTVAWRRATRPTPPLVNDVVFFDSTTVTLDSTRYDWSAAGGELRVYPQYGGADAVSVVIDEVELAPAIVVDDTTAWWGGARVQEPVLYAFRAGYGFDGRTQARMEKSRSDADVLELFATAESREIPQSSFIGSLVDAADAAVVTEAGFQYYSNGRLDVPITLLEIGDVPINVGTVIYLATTRTPSTPGDNPLVRVTAFTEQAARDGAPPMTITAEGQYDPAADLATLVAS